MSRKSKLYKKKHKFTAKQQKFNAKMNWQEAERRRKQQGFLTEAEWVNTRI